jgi:hypothetical protein
MGQPVYPNSERETPPEEATGAPPAESASTEAQSPKTIEIQGKEYTEDQLRGFVEGSMRQQDYTRKTQELAEMRRQMEEERATFEAERAELAEQYSQQTHNEEYQDPSDARLQKLASQMSKLTEAFEKREARDQETLRRFEAEESLEAALDHYKEAPFFNREEMKQWIQIKGLSADQVDVAYNSLYGAKLGEQYGHMKAVQHGASTPPVMGAGPSAISPGFTHPSEVPGGTEDYSKYSMRDLAKLAAQDPDIPNAG